ncbi:ecdysone receptor-like isoform X1 [Bicyclus anynana]|uniref:Ecdysone receptor-like isoform X1 n=1 Tax=Bicyclus anynana TaxID=110368 RepID=A0ABM3LF26_BICAN|nr:ecdysone receptor-like isoform X1 [Bicyclus anynana]
MDLKHEVAYRGIPGQVKAEPGVSHNGHPNGHVRDWMAGGGSPSPAAAPPQPNGYSSPLSSGSYGPYSPNGKIGKTTGFRSPARSLLQHEC